MTWNQSITLSFLLHVSFFLQLLFLLIFTFASPHPLAEYGGTYVPSPHAYHSTVTADVDTSKPDEKSIITYVASYYHTFARMKNELKGSKRIANVSTNQLNSSWVLKLLLLSFDLRFAELKAGQGRRTDNMNQNGLYSALRKFLWFYCQTM